MDQFVIILSIASVISASALPSAKEESFSEELSQLLDVEIREHAPSTPTNGRSLEDHIEEFVKNHDVSFSVPLVGSKLTLDARNLENEELGLKINYGDGNEVARRKKSRLRRAFVPILIFILIKAMILIPLALGILGFKTWNAIQLSFASFVVSTALAIWKLCTKVNHEAPPAIIHSGWDHDRTDVAQQLAYSAYAPAQ